MKIWDDQTISRDKSVVVIGPNGSGKTRYGIRLASLNNADHIGALRNIALQENLQMKSYTQAENEVRDTLHRKRQHYWELSSEIDILFSKLMADDASSATKFRDQCVAGISTTPETTKIMEVKQLWEKLFPSRSIRFDGYVPKVTSGYNSGEYAARYMSDGERVALYLAARVLDSSAEMIIIDEPEVHFHSKLAVSFWDELEKMRPAKKFVYITHNLEFALSREMPIFLIVKPNEKPQVVENFSDISREIAIDLLAAASLSIFAKRIIFCEGDKNSSFDLQILNAWFNDKDTSIISLGSCKNVIESALSYKKTDIIKNVEIVGIVDQDYYSAQAIDAIKNDVFVLPYHEIESVLLAEDVIREVLAHSGKSVLQANEIVSEIKRDAKACFNKEIINKTISERFKKSIEFNFLYSLRGAKSSADDQEQKQQHLAAVSSVIPTSASEYDTCCKEINEAFDVDYQTVLRLLPGKPLTRLLFSKCGISKEVFVNILCKLVKENNQNIISALSGLLPPRTIAPITDHP